MLTAENAENAEGLQTPELLRKKCQALDGTAGLELGATGRILALPP